MYMCMGFQYFNIFERIIFNILHTHNLLKNENIVNIVQLLCTLCMHYQFLTIKLGKLSLL